MAIGYILIMLISNIKNHGLHPAPQDPQWASQVFHVQPITREEDRLRLQIMTKWNNEISFAFSQE